MKNRFIILVFLLVFVPMTSNAGVLFSEWGMSADTLMNDSRSELKNKSLKCEVSCSVSANYMMFDQEMRVKYWFSSNDSAVGGLKEIWMSSEEFDGNNIKDSGKEKEQLFNEFKKLYTSRFGEPVMSYKDDTMELLGIKTHDWGDSTRKNDIQLEMWLKRVRVKYLPLVGN